jgi:hypothetical protein
MMLFWRVGIRKREARVQRWERGVMLFSPERGSRSRVWV